MDERKLEKSEGMVENDNEHTTWVEYRLNGEVVHRSAHVMLKKPAVFADVAAGDFNG
jgi:hypothetical protein